MKFFVKAIAAQEPQTPNTKTIALWYTGVLVVMLVAQLFTFDDFNELLLNSGVPFSPILLALMPPLVVAAELLALPFLLRMRLSPAFRWLSMVCGWLVCVLWLVISAVFITVYPQPETVGFLGTLAPLIPGWWSVMVALLFGVMAAWASWGMWPGKSHK